MARDGGDRTLPLVRAATEYQFLNRVSQVRILPGARGLTCRYIVQQHHLMIDSKPVVSASYTCCDEGHFAPDLAVCSPAVPCGGRWQFIPQPVALVDSGFTHTRRPHSNARVRGRWHYH